jgi:GT2 family glycosyltransferase
LQNFSVSQQAPLVVVIVLNWNGKRNTVECLNSLFDLEYTNYEIVVVDNASTDGSQEFMKRSFPQITIIQNLRNLGFGEGFNVGIRAAIAHGADYVLCLNNDVVVDKPFLKEIVRVGETDIKIGGLCPLEFSYSQPDRIVCAGGSIGFVRGKLRGFGELDKGQYSKTETTGLLSGPAMMLKLIPLKNIGLFDCDYFYGPEDQDIAFRMLKAGYKLVFVPKAKVWHKRRGATNGKITPLNDYFHVRNYLLFAKKNASNGDLFFSFLYFGLVDFPITFIKRIFAGKWRHSKAILTGVIWHFNHRIVPSDSQMVELLSKT